VCAIKGAVGLTEPFYNYRIGTLVHSSRELDVFTRMDTLYLSNDLTGSTELCSLFLHPDYRSGNNGKLLSKSRFLFIAQFPHLFTEKLIAEMRGYQEESGRSPFYEGLGRHFFKMDFDHVDALTAVGKKSFIAELMPRQPLYVDYLPQDAQDVIGKVHTSTAPARRLLEQEGMYFEGYVDIFDAGPCCRRACPSCAPCATARWPKSASPPTGIPPARRSRAAEPCWCRTPPERFPHDPVAGGAGQRRHRLAGSGAATAALPHRRHRAHPDTQSEEEPWLTSAISSTANGCRQRRELVTINPANGQQTWASNESTRRTWRKPPPPARRSTLGTDAAGRTHRRLHPFPRPAQAGRRRAGAADLRRSGQAAVGSAHRSDHHGQQDRYLGAVLRARTGEAATRSPMAKRCCATVRMACSACSVRTTSPATCRTAISCRR
jgi:hypothetical protein